MQPLEFSSLTAPQLNAMAGRAGARRPVAAARGEGPDQDRPEIEALVGPNVLRWQALNARSRRCVIGNGAAGTPDKGETLLGAMSDRLTEVLGTAE